MPGKQKLITDWEATVYMLIYIYIYTEIVPNSITFFYRSVGIPLLS